MTPKSARQYNIDAGILSSVVLLGGVRVSNADDDAPETIELTGIVRDMKERTADGGHPDFEQVPDHGYGVYSGNVGLFLGADGKPVFTGAGRKVTSDYRNGECRPIAPHLYNRRFACSDGSMPDACTVLKDSKGVDAFDVCLVDVSFEDDGTSRWVYRVTEREAGKDLSHWNLKLEPSHTVVAGTTPGFDLGVDGSTGFYGIKWDVTDGFEDQVFTIVLDGHLAGGLDDEGVLAKGGNSPDRGAMFVPTTTVSETGSPYPSGPMLVDDPSLDDDEGEMSYSDQGGIQSSETFDQWFTDVMGVNMSRPLTLTLHRQEDGSYVFDDKDDPTYEELGGFFPIESTLFGNSGGTPDRNFHFTFELNTKFTYAVDGDQVFKFIGDDDVWVFIDGKLAIDLGGVHGAKEQYVDLNRFCLEDGQTYTLDFFFAERHRTQSNFRIETNLELEPASENALPMMTMAFD